MRHIDPRTGPRRTNRRVTQRAACRLSVRYSTGDDWHPATAVDLSTAGCRLRLGEDLARGMEVAVVFETLVTDGSQALSVEVPGMLIWSRPEGLSHQAGIRFETTPASLDAILSALAPPEPEEAEETDEPPRQ